MYREFFLALHGSLKRLGSHRVFLRATSGARNQICRRGLSGLPLFKYSFFKTFLIRHLISLNWFLRFVTRSISEALRLVEGIFLQNKLNSKVELILDIAVKKKVTGNLEFWQFDVVFDSDNKMINGYFVF